MRWLTTVAIREGWRLASTARETPVGAFRGQTHDDEPPEPANTLRAGTGEQAIARVEQENRMADLRRLKPREREALALKALGYSYKEIATSRTPHTRP
jgi:DNA-directed RNA polymerase specialized sigma24 family protein